MFNKMREFVRVYRYFKEEERLEKMEAERRSYEAMYAQVSKTIDENKARLKKEREARNNELAYGYEH